jgi:predicted DNA-binding protein (MmcQ/YjbR family)
MKRGELFSQVAQRYGTEPEYPWPRWPNHAVLRHAENRKWFGIVMNVPAVRLGLESEDMVDVVNLKADPDDVPALQLADGILPAYHMNKEHWVSIILGDALADEMLLDLLETSYRLTS